ncbi:MAG: hypothetical protein II183_00815 [Elusimicrobiaceae bacterium]|nr:hypothetical protein [Elusimicrobiaceae bacterium]
MKFKDLFEVKNISRFLIFAIIIFLFLPLIFPEKNNFKIIKKENAYSHEDSPLPIFPKESILEKYANKFKKFYKIGSESTQETSSLQEDQESVEQTNENIKKAKSSQNADINADDLFFTTGFDDTDIYFANADSSEQKDNDVNLQKGTVITKDKMMLQPTQEGYYHNGKFYKNGTYPPNTNKKYIESALSKYHSRVAKNLGKKALYLADEKGNLTVSYVDTLPNEAATDIDTYLARNRHITNNNTEQRNETYTKNQRERSNNQVNVNYSDIASASIKDMHGAYNLAINKIQNGQMGQDIDINQPFQNALVDNFLNNNNVPSNEITPNKPEEEPPLPPAPEHTEVVIAGDQDFAQNYADKIHELNCGTEDGGNIASEPIPSIPSAIGNVFQVIGDGSAISCDTAPLIVEPSSSITNNISQNSDFERFTDELNNITSQNKNKDISIISTDRNFYPVAHKLNDDETIRNSKNEPVTVHVIGPSETESDLSKVLEGVTYSITDDLSAADKLTEDLANYYTVTQDENPDTHTVLAFPTEDERQVFVLTDPNNSYWLKNPRQLNNLPTQYMQKNGVYYQGVIIDKTQLGNLVSKERTNLLYISDKNYTHYLSNGSALTTVTEDEIKINSLHPEQIQRNSDRVRTLTENGQRNLQKSQQKKQQPIEVIDLEKGNRKIK